MDNSQTRKEGVSYTYKGYDGYAPIAAYLGQEGWCLGST
jgi:S-adenosylmethionine hydrolase